MNGTRSAMIFGAGKIGRGFLAHLLSLSGFEITFVDTHAGLIESMRTRGEYGLHVLGAPQKNARIKCRRALLLDDGDAVRDAIAEHDLFFTAAGGANLAAIGAVLAAGLVQRAKRRGEDAGDANVIICENYKDPAAILREAIMANLADPTIRTWCDAHLGIAETQVLRSCIDPTPELRQDDPLSLQVQDWWVLPCDGEAVRGAPPPIQGLSLRNNFRFELTRKVYTYNCSNAVISYLGWLRGYTMLGEAANDPEILAVTRAVYDESGRALIAEFGFDEQEQAAMQGMALAKYQDRRIADPLERNCRDSLRKLSPKDRLLGPANLAMKHGVRPRHLALAIAAAMHYAGSDDPGTQRVQAILRQEGPAGVLRQICSLDPATGLGAMVIEALPELATFNQRGCEIVK